ncbi:MAG: type II toxin-antitoxin system RelE/ParE family toxin [Bdellovibrionales bacterium]|nr:type II toxin-antitoxin system RelE/ParE family toxin [Bdellovibrionales bacterium]
MKVNFYELPSGRSPIEEFIESLPKGDQARFAEVLVGLEQFGLAYSRVQFKPLRGKLWEIKFSSPGGGFRMAYVLVTAEEMVILHAFRKSTQKTPLRDLDLAEKRMKEVLGL